MSGFSSFDAAQSVADFGEMPEPQDMTTMFYQPGDMTSYVFCYGRTSGISGAPDGVMCVLYLSEPLAFLSPDNGLMHRGYVESKLPKGVNQASVTVLTILVNAVAGDPDYARELEEEYKDSRR